MSTKTTATTVTLKHLAASLAEDNELSKKQAEAILGGLVGNIVKHLKKGERIRIGGLGILQVRKRAACHPDVTKFCQTQLEVNPQDVLGILGCLQANRSKISNACQQVLASHGQ